MSSIRPYDDPDRPREMLDPALAEAALRRMRQAAHGNGIDPRSISMTHLDGETLHFEGRSLFEIKATLAEKSLPGKETQGEICTSASDMRGKIQQTIARSTISRDMLTMASDFLEKRKDKGFAVNNLVVKLDRLNKTFIFYNSCTSCTAGHINCMQCQGAGLINCIKCRGHRTIVCPMCRGTKTSRQPNGSTGTCRKCNGHGESQCSFCRAQGKTKCAACSGTGQAACQKCHSTGVISDIGHVTFEGRTRCTFDPEPLPPELPKLILQTGPALAANAHADIAILREREQDIARQELETTERLQVKDELIVPYYIRLPYADIGFQIGDGAELRGKLFGLHPRLLNFPPFLEQPLAPGMDRMQQAADNLNVRSNVMEAIRYRVLGDALVAVATLPVKKAAIQMRKKWSLGLRQDSIDTIVLRTRIAFANLTKIPRLTGLLMGLAAAGAGYAAYLLERPNLVMLHPYALAALDVVAVGVGAYMGTLASQMNIKRSVRGVFAKIMPPDQIRTIMPRAGSVAVLSVIGSVILFCAVTGGVYAAGRPAPFWAMPALNAVFSQAVTG